MGERSSFELSDEPMVVCPPPWRARAGSRPFLLHRDGRRETITWRKALDMTPRNPGGPGAHTSYGYLVGSDE